MPAVLFVCTGNICRSPLASALFKSLIAEKGVPEQWLVESAGTWATEGLPASTGSLVALANRGLEASNHRSRLISREILETFDLVLTMEKNHKEALQFEFQDLAGRIFLLSEMVDQNFDIEDPIGGPQEEYDRTANQLSDILTTSFEKIYRLATDLEKKHSDLLSGE